jgi:hypothetical protein
MRWLVAIVVCSGCIVAKQSFEVPSNDQTVVVLLTGTLGEPIAEIARHPWFGVRRKGETSWRIYEVGGGGSSDSPFGGHGYGSPILHKVWVGDDGDRAADCIDKVAPDIKHDIEHNYIMYPGPNSNTFGDRVLRKCHLHASLPSTSIGKDWRGLIGAGISSEGTGVQFETPIIGFKIGLKEGIEVHVIGLSIGIDFWPPAIIVPMGPGRIGFADR